MIDNTFEKVSRLNKTILEQLTKAAEMQMTAFQRYSEIALKQVTSATEVRDAEGLKDLTSAQSETLKTLSEQFTADMKAWQDYVSEAREQFQKAISDATEPGAPKDKSGAQKS